MMNRFNLCQSVFITELEKQGRVIAIFISDTGLKYLVRYFDNCEAKEVYFFEDELTEIK